MLADIVECSHDVTYFSRRHQLADQQRQEPQLRQHNAWRSSWRMSKNKAQTPRGTVKSSKLRSANREHKVHSLRGGRPLRALCQQTSCGSRCLSSTIILGNVGGDCPTCGGYLHHRRENLHPEHLAGVVSKCALLDASTRAHAACFYVRPVAIVGL